MIFFALLIYMVAAAPVAALAASGYPGGQLEETCRREGMRPELGRGDPCLEYFPSWEVDLARKDWEADQEKARRDLDAEREMLKAPDGPGSFLSRKMLFRIDGRLRATRAKYVKAPAEDVTTWEEGRRGEVDYRFYHADGSGSFGVKEDCARAIVKSSCEKYPNIKGWKVRCEQDVMSDLRHCHAFRDDLWIFFFQNLPVAVSVGTGHYPNSGVAIRFGKEAPLKASRSGWLGAAATAIVERLKAAEKVMTRYRKWPNDFDVDRETELLGFREAFEYLRWAVCQKGTCKSAPAAVKPTEKKPPASKKEI